MNVSSLKPGHTIYGNKGNVWSGTAHIYKSGTGNLCGTPALATNWAAIEGVQEIGCKGCLEKYGIEKSFDLVYEGVKLNSKPLTEAEADKEILSIIMNHGYRPAKVEIS
jgi:hypothetical protein